jgi:hypothetical protein
MPPGYNRTVSPEVPCHPGIRVTYRFNSNPVMIGSLRGTRPTQPNRALVDAAGDAGGTQDPRKSGCHLSDTRMRAASAVTERGWEPGASKQEQPAKTRSALGSSD